MLLLDTALKAEIRTGSMGDNVIYQWDSETGKVTITGEGAMYNYDNYEVISPFYNSDIKAVTISDGVTSIGSWTFHYCSSLNSIEIPSSVTSIGDHAFYYCSFLSSIELPSNITSIEAWAFYYCSSLTSIKIPSGVTAIGDNSFYCCRSLKTVEIPSSITYIGTLAFNLCTSLTYIYVGNTPAGLRANTFENVDKEKCILYVPTGSTEAYQRAYYWKEFSNILEYTPADIEEVAKYIEFFLKDIDINKTE